MTSPLSVWSFYKWRVRYAPAHFATNGHTGANFRPKIHRLERTTQKDSGSKVDAERSVVWLILRDNESRGTFHFPWLSSTQVLSTGMMRFGSILRTRFFLYLQPWQAEQGWEIIGTRCCRKQRTRRHEIIDRHSVVRQPEVNNGSSGSSLVF